MTKTNIKGLPEGIYFTEIGYSQQYPWVQIKRTEKTATLRKVHVLPDPEWKPEISPGGFCGHCHNQHEQTWLYGGVEDREVIVRLNKRGQWVRKGVRFVDGRAIDFYDYNF